MSSLALFGGAKPWSAQDWTASDDSVRGGHSRSYLNVSSSLATFGGSLDIKTLGNAGFASQRTTTDQPWDLSAYDGILLDLGKSDQKQYTFTIKDQVLPPAANGGEQSTVSWEVEFQGPADHSEVFVKWADLKPTYRGREQKDATPLDLGNIKRFHIMMRSFFGRQEGEFSLDINSISAAKAAKSMEMRDTNLDSRDDQEIPPAKRGWFDWFGARN
ncbi:hypothetical protein DSL72_004257 [Monilinia vaccinii-corymbosi]|uniref:NADH:ubiquinone oxidoreductase intermediate-associated protein 30 domain-containing protein n=1 Tax=Monilinia vaccinii-corymbosi TaxID=61207 RepID=A0A8A3P011_9HELO|nr:hypothetical protein DSL72_004257 [Monilinia vaccinii-corymbosi]